MGLHEGGGSSCKKSYAEEDNFGRLEELDGTTHNYVTKFYFVTPNEINSSKMISIQEERCSDSEKLSAG